MLWALLWRRLQTPQVKCFKEPFFVLGEHLDHFFWMKVLTTIDELPRKILCLGLIVVEVLARLAGRLL